MRKTLKRAAAGLIAALLLTTSGCTASGSTQKQGFQPRLDTDKPVVLSAIGYFGNFEALDQVMNDFNAYYPKVGFSYQLVSNRDEEAYLKVNTDVDLIMTSSELLYKADAMLLRCCIDLTEAGVDLSAVDTDLLQGSCIDGRQLSIPIGQNLYGMVVNVSLLEKEGLTVPRNLTEFLNVLSVLKEKGYTPIQGPNSKVYAEITGGMIFSGLCEGQPLRQALDKGDMEAAENLVVPALQLIDTLVQSGYIDPAVNAAYPDDNYDGAILRFFEGNVPFWVCNTEKVSGMKKRETKSETFKNNPFSYCFTFVPVGETGQYLYREPWYGIAANKTGSNADYAVEFLRYLATQAGSNKMADVKGVPSAAKVTSTPAVYARALDEKQISASHVSKGEITFTISGRWYTCVNQYLAGEYASAQEAAQDFLSICTQGGNATGQ